MGDILKDSRFTKYLNDPRYKQIPKHERKVKIDKRFNSMFKDEKFKVKYTVDKRGRPVNETSTENLRKYYELHSEESSSDNEDEPNLDDNESKVPGQFVKRPQTDDGEIDTTRATKNDKLIRGNLQEKTKERLLVLEIDYARGEGLLQTDSSSDEESSEEDNESELEHEWGELDADAETTNLSTKRFAICNMDWDNIKAQDIMVLLSSFLPSGGVIHKVTIYPSEYGLQRMKEEETRGPIELTEQKDISDDSGNEEGSSFHMEKLRKYQLNRLKYYYAVVECDTATTADKIYMECDGLEYESSATKLDLRFIPDDITFEQEPREECKNLPDLTNYKPRLFTTTALQQAKVELTWDATNPNRKDAIKKAIEGKIDDLDLKEYLASSTDESDDDIELQSESQCENGDPIEKYKNLLKEIQQKEDTKQNKDMEMEITWGLGVKDKAEEMVKKKMNKDDKNLTPFEKIVEKRKEKKKLKKLERLEKLKKDNENSNSESESSEDIPSDIDMNDPYFASEFIKPEFRKVNSKNKKKERSNDSDDSDNEKAELELLLDDNNDGKAHFSLKKIQESENTNKKSKQRRKLKDKLKQKQLPDFEINVDDKRFSALYESHLYNIDPTDANYKKTKNMEKLIQEKLKRRPAEASLNTEVIPKKSKEDAELNFLIKNIKRKTKNVPK